MEIKKKYVPDGNQGHWLIYNGNGDFLCSCDDAELAETLKATQEEAAA